MSRQCARSVLAGERIVREYHESMKLIESRALVAVMMTPMSISGFSLDVYALMHFPLLRIATLSTPTP